MKKNGLLLKNSIIAVYLILLIIILPGCGISTEKSNEYNDGALFNFGLALVSKNGKWGFVDEKGKEIIPIKYSYLSDFGPEGLAAVCISSENGSKYAFMNPQGEIVGEKYFDKARGFVRGYAAVCVDGSWGFIDKNLEYFVEPQFAELKDFDGNGYAVGTNGFEEFFIDLSGKFVDRPLAAHGLTYNDERLEGLKNNYGIILSEPIYEFVSTRCVDRNPVAYHVRKDGKTGIADIMTGEIILDPIYDDVEGYFPGNGMCAVCVDGKWGYVNSKGETLINFKFDFACSFSEGFARVNLNKKWGYINESGEYYVTPAFDDTKDFSQGRAAVKLGSKWGFIDDKGYFIAEPQFDFAKSFKNGYAAVSVDGKWGFIDLSGDIVIEPKFESVNDFTEDGFAWIGINLGSGCIVYYANGVINTKGDVIFEPDEVNIEYYKDGYFVVKRKTESKLYNSDGTPVSFGEYDSIGVEK